MIPLPQVAYAEVHEGPTVFGSFVDSEWVLHYIAAGRWCFQMRGNEYFVNPGDMVLLPPRLLHVVRQVSGAKRAQYVVHFELGGGGMGGEPPLALSLPVAHQREIATLFKRLRREWLFAEPYADWVAGGILAEMLGLYCRHGNRPTPGSPFAAAAWQNIELSVAFLHRNFPRPELSLREISAACRVSPNYLCRIFKENTGFSPMAYLTLLRHSKAQELLLRSLQNCTEIAEAVGFGDLHVFSRTFKKLSGQSPSEFRRLHARHFDTL